jgi:hypothetical protein
MLKFLLISALVVYILSKIGSFFFRAGVASQPRQQQRRPPNPEPPPQKSSKPRNFKGGDYVDYEEVK